MVQGACLGFPDMAGVEGLQVWDGGLGFGFREQGPGIKVLGSGLRILRVLGRRAWV